MGLRFSGVLPERGRTRKAVGGRRSLRASQTLTCAQPHLKLRPPACSGAEQGLGEGSLEGLAQAGHGDGVAPRECGPGRRERTLCADSTPTPGCLCPSREKVLGLQAGLGVGNGDGAGLFQTVRQDPCDARSSQECDRAPRAKWDQLTQPRAVTLWQAPRALVCAPWSRG